MEVASSWLRFSLNSLNASSPFHRVGTSPPRSLINYRWCADQISTQFSTGCLRFHGTGLQHSLEHLSLGARRSFCSLEQESRAVFRDPTAVVSWSRDSNFKRPTCTRYSASSEGTKSRQTRFCR